MKLTQLERSKTELKHRSYEFSEVSRIILCLESFSPSIYINYNA
jgi:hypothetical protein